MATKTQTQVRPILIGSQTSIPRELLRDEVRLVSDLTIVTSSRTGKAFYCLAEEDIETDSYLVPRAIDITPYLKSVARTHLCILAEPLEREYWWPPVSMTLQHVPPLGPNEAIRYDQAPAWKALTSPPVWPWGKILALGCGKGKTFLGLRLACVRDTKTLVVCHTNAMIDTWTTLARDLFGIAEEDIGVIGGKRIEWEDKKIVFSTMPGILCRQYPEEFFTDFGLVLFDEGDLLGAEKMSRMLPLFLGERVILTATPERRDGAHVLYEKHVGPIAHYDVQPDLQPTCYVIDSPVPAKASGESMQGYCWSRFTQKMEPHIPRTINKLSAYSPRFWWALDTVRALLSEGRKVLFLGERVEELKQLNTCLSERTKYTTGLALGMKHMPKGAKLDDILASCDCIWGIGKIAKRGLNEPSFDTLVIQYASFNDPNILRQVIGRVLRYQEGKQDPLVVILNDPEISCMSKNATRLAHRLERDGYKLEWYDGET